MIYDQDTNAEYIPLNHIEDGQESLLVYDSLLSEYAACGFEYGYSVAEPDALVIWEAQFGDFANGAQIIFDQFFSAAEEKWGQTSSLVLLLPHGFEGQGPEHSSARLERFLQMCAEGNMTVCTFTTPANYFHALRRQASPEIKAPLVVMSPKSLLRHPEVVSAPDAFSSGSFQPMIPDARASESAKRHIFCSGKIYFDLLHAQRAMGEDAHGVAISRIEQFYPFPTEDVKRELGRFGNAQDVLWVQEEPENMGAWTFIRSRFDELLLADDRNAMEYIGRAPSASPATGSAQIHQAEQNVLISDALGLDL